MGHEQCSPENLFILPIQPNFLHLPHFVALSTSADFLLCNHQTIYYGRTWPLSKNKHKYGLEQGVQKPLVQPFFVEDMLIDVWRACRSDSTDWGSFLWAISHFWYDHNECAISNDGSSTSSQILSVLVLSVCSDSVLSDCVECWDISSLLSVLFTTSDLSITCSVQFESVWKILEMKADCVTIRNVDWAALWFMRLLPPHKKVPGSNLDCRLSVWSLHVLPVSVWALFLPQSKDMILKSKLVLCLCVINWRLVRV